MKSKFKILWEWATAESKSIMLLAAFCAILGCGWGVCTSTISVAVAAMSAVAKYSRLPSRMDNAEKQMKLILSGPMVNLRDHSHSLAQRVDILELPPVARAAMERKRAGNAAPIYSEDSFTKEFDTQLEAIKQVGKD